MLGTIAFVVLCLFVAACLFLIWVVRYWGPKYERKERTLPIVCVCRVPSHQDRIGVVLRTDYEKASVAQWLPYIEGKKRHDPGGLTAPDGVLLKIEQVFVFSNNSKEYHTLVYGCFVERATFHVPITCSGDMNNISGAWQYIYGKPWGGRLLNR